MSFGARESAILGALALGQKDLSIITQLPPLDVLWEEVAFTRAKVIPLAFGVVMIVAPMLALALSSVAANADNDRSFEDADEVHNNEVVVGYLNEIDDDDYFKIYLETGEIVSAFLVVPDYQDFDLYLCDPSYALLDSSTINNTDVDLYFEWVYAQALSDGWYYIIVAEYEGSGTYLLQITATAQWTVMVYLDGDCDLESEAIADFMEMSSVGSTSEVNVVVQFDRWDSPGDPSDCTDYGDWVGCERFLVTQGMTPEVSNSIEQLGEVNMGDPQTLMDFSTWAIEWFPAHNYALVFWDHGGSWDGVCWDESESPSDRLTMSELSQGLSGILSSTSLPAIDVAWFDACNMASIEVACQVDDYCSYIVGSEKTEPGTGANYALTLSALVGNPLMTPAELSSHVVADFVNSYDSSPEPGYAEDDVTQSAVDAGSIGNLVYEVDRLASELLANMTAYVNYVELCWYECEYYDYDYLDLYDFCRLLSLYLPEGTARGLAISVMEAVDAAVYAEAHWDAPGGDVIVNAHGLTIYFPDQAYYDPAYVSSVMSFTADTHWDEFLSGYYAAIASWNNPPSIQTWLPASDPTIDEGQSVEFQVDASDPDGNALTYVWVIDSSEILTGINSSYTYDAGYDNQGIHTVSVMVWDGADYVQHDWTLTVVDVPPNTPPVAAFTVFPGMGDVLTVFSFNASSCSDAETPLSGLEFRWDWDGDGMWDTDWLANPVATYQFTSPDTYTVRLEVRDAGGLTDTAEQTVVVTEEIPELSSVIVPVLLLLVIISLAVQRWRRTSRS